MGMTRRQFIVLGSTAGVGAAGAAILSRRGSANIPSSAQRGPERFVSAHGLLNVELVAAENWVQLAGTRALLYAFNGQVPGPLMELESGDEVRLRFTNQLAEPTNLHFHGTHLSPEGKADNVFLQIPEGGVFDYSFRVPLNHPAGFFWVHPHLHGRVARQVSLGLAAPFVIRGVLDRIPEVSAAREHFLIVQDFELDSRGRPVDPGMSAMMLGREGSLITVSGMRNPQYVIEQDGLLRLRLLNASASRFLRLTLEDHPMHVIATDGGGLAAPQSVDELVLAPGERRDVLVQGTRESGSYRLINLPYDRGGMGMMGRGMMGGRGGMMGEGPRISTGSDATGTELARIVYQGRSEQRMLLPHALGDVDALLSSTVRRSFELRDAMGMIPGRGMGMRFLINGREFDHERIDTRVRLDAVEDWEYVNSTTMDHPIHIHTNSFQLVGSDGRPERAWRDIVIVKARSRARVRIRFRDFVGTTVQHCHILDHEDLGMMATMLIER